MFVGVGASATDTSFVKVTIEDNTFTGSNGIPIRPRSQGANTTLHAIVRRNTVSGLTATSGSIQAMRVDSGASTTGVSTVCLQVEDNTFTPFGATQEIMVRRDIGPSGAATPDAFGIVGLTPSPATSAQVIAYINSKNPNSTSTVPSGIVRWLR